ncbi:hypothetical protein SD70_00105 [Gordoniibacillus kamchatkensis]|uniref:YmaF family protein n=1 Tax=Gordoniibacillus kamchatkensis TaxID=1590651 RepID=A0ABR5ANV7_9BACL|nr:hypothetical protein SD70_00105 [Paenibacillus sp. VKM B-2647]
MPDARLAPPHTHYLYAVTSTQEGHCHQLETFVYAANGNAYDSHSHYFQGITEKAAGHWHRFYDQTGPAIPLPDGSHYHTFSDVTYYNYTRPVQVLVGAEPLEGGVYYQEGRERHRHFYSGATSVNLGDPPPGW